MSITNADNVEILNEIKGKMSSSIPLLRTPKTVQILLIRQTHDYTVLRTEETRELNIGVTPTSITDSKQKARVVFLASKQKAPETREFAAFVREQYKKVLSDKPDQKDVKEQILECEIKDKLCRTCPRCTLFGAVVTDNKHNFKRWNIKHRIEYSSAFSLEAYELISENITFNAVTESTQLTEQALGVTENVSPLANFPSIISLNTPTWQEFVLVIKNLLRCKSYGAEGRTKGDTVNYITGLIFADEEVLTSLEYVLELENADKSKSVIEQTCEIVKKYADMASLKDNIKFLTADELEQLIDGIQDLQISEEFITKAFTDSLNFAKAVDKLAP
jgi:CRISPR type I-D-associated protein Csc2